MKAILAALSILVLMATASSGCIVANEKGVEDTASPSAASSAAPNATVAAPVAPVAAIFVTVDNATVEAVNGTIPLAAGLNATFDASNSTGDNLTYAWDFGDNETASDAVVNHTFAAAGNFTVNLTVTSGDSEHSGNASVTIVVAKGGPASGDFIRTDAKTFTGTILIGSQGATCGTAGQNGVDRVQFTWELTAAEPDGTPTVVKRVKLVMSGAGAVHVDSDLVFLDPTGKVLKESAGGSPAETIEMSQVFPPGKYTIRANGCAVVNGSVTIKAEADYFVV